MDGQAATMRWTTFLVGFCTFILVVSKNHKTSSGSQLWAFLSISGALMIVALLTPLISSVKLGPEGLELTTQKAAAALLVTKHPAVAEAITGEHGQKAVAAALEQIRRANNSEQLQNVVKFTPQNSATLFFTKVGNENRVYKVDPSINTIETFTQEMPDSGKRK